MSRELGGKCGRMSTRQVPRGAGRTASRAPVALIPYVNFVAAKMVGSFLVLKATRVADEEMALAKAKEIEGAKDSHQVHGADPDGMKRGPGTKVLIWQPRRHAASGRCLGVADP